MKIKEKSFFLYYPNKKLLIKRFLECFLKTFSFLHLLKQKRQLSSKIVVCLCSRHFFKFYSTLNKRKNSEANMHSKHHV